MERSEKTLKVINPLGLHARAAAQLVKVTARVPCSVTLSCDGESVNGKSIMGVLTLAAAQGSDVVVTCEGTGSEEALTQIEAVFTAGFYELRP